MGHDAQSVDPFGAKPCIKNPAGPICRKERRLSFVSFIWFVSFLWFEELIKPDELDKLDEPSSSASGLGSQLPGSDGTLSRPATVKLLTFPPASAAQR
jgi:hypothetical protein